jgi:mono/diheme cytochrome c family protein
VRRRLIACTTAAALAIVAAGCGGASSDKTTTHAQLTAEQQRGKEIFIRSCGSCHKLSDAGTQGIVGKNLDETKPSYATVLRTLAVPPKNMPSRLVTNAADAKAVAAYVAAVTGGAGP